MFSVIVWFKSFLVRHLVKYRVKCDYDLNFRDINNGDTASNLSAHIQTLRSEVTRLRNTLAISQQEHTEKMQRYVNEERNIREENLRLQRKLQLEVRHFRICVE